jgi:general secretion pathway protein G
LFLVSAIVPTAVTAGMLLPALAKAKQRAQTINCINNLKKIDVAKQAWALEEKKGSTDVPTISDLLPHLGGGSFPKCPAGGTYTIGALSTTPECSIPHHVLQK